MSDYDQKGWQAIQRLRAKAASQRMIVARSELQMPAAARLARRDRAQEALDELLWWTEMLKAKREERLRARRAHRHADLSGDVQGNEERR